MRKLSDKHVRRAASEMFLTLAAHLTAPLPAMGVTKREARNLDLIVVWAAVVVNHAREKRSTALKLAKHLNIPRTTVTRQLDVMTRIGYLAWDGSECWVADRYAEHSAMGRERWAILFNRLFRLLNHSD